MTPAPVVSAPAVPGPAGRLAWALAEQLRWAGIDTQVSEVEGIALVGIWAVDLTVWCEFGPNGWRYQWRLGVAATGGVPGYTSCPCSALETAAQRIARLYRERFEAMYPAAAARQGGVAR
jgi:hypothetical protein